MGEGFAAGSRSGKRAEECATIRNASAGWILPGRFASRSGEVALRWPGELRDVRDVPERSDRARGQLFAHRSTAENGASQASDESGRIGWTGEGFAPRILEYSTYEWRWPGGFMRKRERGEMKLSSRVSEGSRPVVEL